MRIVNYQSRRKMKTDHANAEICKCKLSVYLNVVHQFITLQTVLGTKRKKKIFSNERSQQRESVVSDVPSVYAAITRTVV